MSASIWDPSGFLNTVYAKSINFLQSGVGAVLRTVQNKLEDTVSIKDFGVVSGGTVQTALIQTAITSCIATGRSLLIPAGTYLVDDVLNIPGTLRIFGDGNWTVLRQTVPSKNLFYVTGSDVVVEKLQLQGSATSETNSTFAFFSDVSAPATGLYLSRIKFSGATAGVGFNSAIKYDDACNYGTVVDCTFERLWGTSSGRGYGVLAGAVIGLQVRNCIFTASAARGRHAVYLSAGATYCKITDNQVYSFQYEGITLNSLGAQPPNAFNDIEGNVVIGCCTAIPTIQTGCISIFGHAYGNKIAGNLIRNSKGCGIKIDGTTFTDTAQTTISENIIVDSDYIGIELLSAVGGKLIDNTIVESSRSAAGTYTNIQLRSDATTAVSNWLIEGNHSYGPTYARSPFRLDSTAPTPTNLKVFGNKFDQCNFAGVELVGVTCAIDGRITFTQAAVTFGPIANGASANATYAVPGAAVGDVVTATHDSNSIGCSIYPYVSSTGNITVSALNNSGAGKTIGPGTLTLHVTKTTP